MKHKFDLSNDKRQELIGLIINYFSNERNEHLGELAATFILDFFIDELAPTFYNLGVEDAHAYLHEKLEDIFEIQK